MSSNPQTGLAKQDTAIRDYTKDGFFTQEQWQLMTDMIMKGATPPEIAFFGEVCKRVGLDPFKKQIHAVKRWDSDQKRYIWSYQTGIDGYRSIANSCGDYAGSDEPIFMPPDESAPHPRKATVTVWKIVRGQRVPFTASARWEEYVQTTKEGKPNSMWRKMPYGQLGKCAEALALRKAWPDRLSGVHTDIEMEQADSEGDPPNLPASANAAPRFDTTIRPFEKPAEAAPPPPPQQQNAEPAPIEAETVDAWPIPDDIAAHINGRWKAVLGDIKGADLTKAREEGSPAALASVIDQVRAILAAKSVSEETFADGCGQQLEGLAFPQDLWMDPDLYPSILKLAKSIA